ncbi:MAG TPA: DciA family protein [Fusobacterium sp.]|uniref:DciA family protein n=1 Tax=Fusobacterium sp. TaxID=68766 RepID=UPI002F4175BE
MKLPIHKLFDIVQEEFQNNVSMQEAFLKVHWESIVGKYSRYSEILWFREGKLCVKIYNSMALQHMYMNKNKILNQINEYMKVKKIVIEDMKYILEGKHE